MFNKVWRLIVLGCGLAALPVLSAGTAARADSYPYQGAQNFRIDGVVSMVDSDRDRVTITAPDGHLYNLDTSETNIKLRTTKAPGNTGDLAVGMHVRVSGRLLSSDIVAADQLTVLPYESSRPTAPTASPAAPSPVSAASHIRLRGTVESVNDEDGVVTVHVNDHVRTIYVNDNTNLTDITGGDDNHIGVHPGDRITVSGTLRPDGSVTADAISQSRDLGASESAPIRESSNGHELVGRVTHESSPFMNRDIKVRIDPGREVTVHVQHEARVQRNGHPISVHNLTKDDVVRVLGFYDGDTFTASQIDVLSEYNGED